MRWAWVTLLSTMLLWPATVIAGELPGWLAGGWRQDVGGGWVEEQWSRPHGGEMAGLGRTVEEGEPAGFEQMRIVREPDGTLTFHAAPNGEDVTVFPLLSQAADEIVFLNPDHDYPQRIRYRRDGDVLHAEVALKDGSRARAWTYRRVTRVK